MNYSYILRLIVDDLDVPLDYRKKLERDCPETAAYLKLRDTCALLKELSLKELKYKRATKK